jgi:KipI family sensor histidine kinase inhibitor
MGKCTNGQSHVYPAWRWVGDRGLQVTTGESTLARHADLIGRSFDEVEDIILADGSLLLTLRRGRGVSEALRAALLEPLPADPRTGPGKRHEITVDYGGVAGPDLETVATLAGMGAADYINRHAAVEYEVAFLGFQPGFPYLRGLPRALHAPRRAAPRVQVAAGSVAVGGAYTGIYPASGPAGWQIIGRTASVLFDPEREPPALLMPGDRVRFVPR